MSGLDRGITELSGHLGHLIRQAAGPHVRVGDAAGIAAALADAKTATSPPIRGVSGSPAGTHVIELPPGDITITEAYGLLGSEGMSANVIGLRFVGAGKHMTRVIFDPTDPADLVLARNDYWIGLNFSNLTFITKQPGAVFMESHTTHHAQEYTFTSVAWEGPWRYVFDLQGDNNNSEYLFIGCGTSGMEDGGAFLHIGDTNTSDQFLNYWFYGFKRWSTTAALIDAAKGGHFHLYGVDASDWGRGLTSPAYLINLRGAGHNAGVMSMTANGLRVEPKSAHAGLLHSEWGDGNVSIECDWSSQVFAYTYNDIISLDVGNGSGAVYHFHDSNLAGGVRVKYGVGGFAGQQSIRFTDCNWAQRLTPTEAVSYDETAAGANKSRPAIRFENCRGTHQNPFSAGGASAWDAVVSYNRGPLVKTLEKRSLVLRGIYGNLRDTDGPLRVNLPVGALITGVSTVSASGAGVGACVVSTTEATPTVVARTGEPMPPFHCATRERATITVHAEGATRARHEDFLVVEGYW